MNKIMKPLSLLTFTLLMASAHASALNLDCLEIFDGVHHRVMTNLIDVAGASHQELSLQMIETRNRRCSGPVAAVPTNDGGSMYMLDCNYSTMGIFKLFQSPNGRWSMTRTWDLIGGPMTFDYECVVR